MFGYHDRSKKVIEGVQPTFVVEDGEKEVKEEEGIVSVNDDVDLAMNERDETFSSPRSNEKVKDGGDVENAKEHPLRIKIQL